MRAPNYIFLTFLAIAANLCVFSGCSSSETSNPADSGILDAADHTDGSIGDATPGTDATPGADATPGTDATPGADASPGTDATPGADAEVTDAGLCDGSPCPVTCETGFHDCGGNCVSNTEVATCGARCEPCPGAANATATCENEACAFTCTSGFEDCDHDPDTGCEADLSTPATCGRCSNHCPNHSTCEAGECRLANDHCSDAVDLATTNPRSTVAVDLTTFGSDLEGCAGPGADAFFRFTIAERELVYADTFGTSFDTSLYFASSCTELMSVSTTTGDVLCSNDTCGGAQSQVVALLSPGTYYLVVSGVGGATGRATIHFEHVAIGLGAVTHLESGHASLQGTTSGQGRVFGCQALGPEAAFWWASCPATAMGRLDASLCTGTSFDSVLEFLAPRLGVDTCADDVCGIQASMSTNVPAGAGLSVLVVDGLFRTEQGAFTLDVTRP